MNTVAPVYPRDAEEWRYAPSEFWAGISSQTHPLNAIVSISDLSERVTIVPGAEMVLPDWACQLVASVLPAARVVSAATEWIKVDAAGQVGQLSLDVSVPDSVSAQIPVWITTSSDTVVTIGVCLSGAGAANVMIVADVSPAASLTLSIVDDTGQPSLASVIANQGAESQFHIRVVDAGDTHRARSICIHQVGVSAVSSVKALNLGSGSSQTFFHTALNHHVERGQSTQLVKSILTDHAVSEFNGAVHVAKGAQKTDSSQSNPNMVLSDAARAISRPQLHIYADDVKCAHGATMSQIDDEQIYYLQSRGVSRASAQSILMVGFADDVLDDLRHESVAQRARAMAKRFFNHVNRA